MKKGVCAIAVLMLGAAIAAPAYPQTASPLPTSANSEPPQLRAATMIVPPFVMEQNGSLTGFSIELWKAITARLKLKTSFQIMPTPAALEDAMRSKSADIAVAPVYITSARNEDFDFLYPTLEAGLQIMVRNTGETARTASPLLEMLRLMSSRTTVVWLGMAMLLVLIPAHLVWMLERGRQDDGVISSRDYFPGIFQAIYWAMSTLTTQAETMPRQWLARVLAIFWMFVGVVFVAFYTAQLTTALTVERIRGAIEAREICRVSRSLP